jgi:hypothetical protein
VLLKPGTYQISVVGGTNLAYVFSTLYPDSSWASTQPVAIAQFTVSGRGPTLGDAVDLGTIGSTAQVVSGSLDPNDYHAAVALYQITLGSGHFWLLDAKVAAQAIGSPLQPALSLFDAQGNVLAVRNSGTGLPADPNDPYLFTGLAPGTYYLGISGAGDLPGVPDGYNPVTGVPGVYGLNQPGGPFAFQLSVSADPADTPTTLVGFTLDHADPLEPSPTGMTLTFSSPIDPAGLITADGRLH